MRALAAWSKNDLIDRPLYTKLFPLNIDPSGGCFTAFALLLSRVAIAISQFHVSLITLVLLSSFAYAVSPIQCLYLYQLPISC